MTKSRMLRFVYKVTLLFFLAGLCLTGYSADSLAGTQAVTVSPAEARAVDGSPVALKLRYTVPEGTAVTTGIGIRIHFNSAAIASLTVEDVYAPGLLAQDSVSRPDESDFDGDPSTDRYLGIAWMDLGGTWPREAAFPVILGTIVVTAAPGSPADETTIGISSSETTVGYRFAGAGARIVLK